MRLCSGHVLGGRLLMCILRKRWVSSQSMSEHQFLLSYIDVQRSLIETMLGFQPQFLIHIYVIAYRYASIFVLIIGAN